MTNKPAVTRKEIRKAICLSIGMPFFVRFPDGSNPKSTSTPNLLVDDNLTQADDYWNGTWLFFSGSSGSNAGQVRYITDFSSGSNGLVPEFALPGSPAVAETYELLNIWSANEVHDAINRAIRSGFPAFFDTLIDESIILEEDKVEYDLTSISPRPWVITKLFLEWSHEAYEYVVSSSAATSVTCTATVSSNVAAGWKISIYDGTGAGQLRTVDTVSGATINITSAWTTNPDTTSKIKVWNPTTYMEWWPLQAARFDAKEYPQKLYLTRRYPDKYGFRIRIQYDATPNELSADSDETEVPLDYLIPKARSTLYSSRLMDNRVERNKYATGVQDNENRAKEYRDNNAFKHQDQTLWLDEDRSDGSYPVENPLAWNNS